MGQLVREQGKLVIDTTEDIGSVEAARVIDPLCILWCISGFLRNECTHAFKVLHD